MQIEKLFVPFIVIAENPLFRVMVVVDQSQDHLLHVPGVRRSEISGIDEVERNCLPVG